MTAIELNAEIYRNLGYLADSEDYLQAVVNFLKGLAQKKRSKDASTASTPVKKFKVDMSRPLPSDKYVGMLHSTREDDEKAREEYMKEKYGRYL